MRFKNQRIEISRLTSSYFFILLASSLLAQSKIDCSIIESFDSDKVAFVVDEIPKKALKLYSKKYDDKLNIANHDEEWNSSGIVSYEDKNAQLIYSGSEGDKGFVFLKTGGLGILVTCIIYDLKCKMVENVAVSDPTISALPFDSSLPKLKGEISKYLDCAE